jgi:dCTP deaminase
MIPSDREILAALARGAIRLTPAPLPERIASMSVDLTLAAQLRRWKPRDQWGAEVRVRPASPSHNLSALVNTLTEPVTITEEGYELAPGDFVLAWTAERLQLPHRSRIAARVEGKSSLARLGLGVHVTAPTIHAGFGYIPELPDHLGTALQLEIWNVGKLPIVLDVGMPICQLIFEEVHGTPEKGYGGMFAEQGPEAP